MRPISQRGQLIKILDEELDGPERTEVAVIDLQVDEALHLLEYEEPDLLTYLQGDPESISLVDLHASAAWAVLRRDLSRRAPAKETVRSLGLLMFRAACTLAVGSVQVDRKMRTEVPDDYRS